MVAVAQPVPRAARSADWRWVAAGLGVVVAAAGLTLVTGASGPGRTTLALLLVLVGGAVWAGVYTLFGARAACWTALVTVLVLSTARLPVRHAADFEWAQALYGTDQVGKSTLPIDPATGDPRALRVWVEANFPGAQAPYTLATDIAGRPITWACPFAHGRQWLILPLPPGAVHNSDPTPVWYRVEGQPNDRDAYLTLFGSYRLASLYIQSFGEPVSPDGGPATVCRAG